MRALIGTELRTESCINNEYATRLAILRFCEGIGDDNPLWTDEDYGAQVDLTGRRSRRRASSSPASARSRSAGRASAASMRNQDDLQQAHPGRRQDHGQRGVRRLRRSDRRQQFRRPAHQGLPAAGIPQPGRRAGRHLHLLAHALRARRDAEARASPRRSSCRIRGPTSSSPRSRRTSSPRSRAARRPATGRTSRSATRSTSSPRGRSD